MGNKTRVVVTGLGAITPIGNDVASFWQGLKDKKVGIAPITYFDTTDYKAKLAGEVKDFDPKKYIFFSWHPNFPAADRFLGYMTAKTQEKPTKYR